MFVYRPTYDILLKRTAIPLILGVVAATLFNTLFVLEFWVLFAGAYLIEYMTSGFINGRLPAAWTDFTYGIICAPAFLFAFLAQFFEINDAIYERISYSETVIINVTSDDSSSRDDDETDETDTDENETDDSDDETDDSADPEDEDTSKGQDDEDAKDGDDEDEDEDEDAKDEDEDEDEDKDEDKDEVTKEDDEDVSENGDDDEAEPSSSTTTSLTVSDGASGTETSVSIKSDASALPSKNPISSHSAASTPTVGICSAVAAVVVSIVAFFL